MLREPRQHLHVPACSECSVNILLFLLLLCGLWPGLVRSGDAPCVQTAVRGKPGLRAEHRLWSLLPLPGSHVGTGSHLQSSRPNERAIQPAVCSPEDPTSNELWQTHIPLGFKFPNPASPWCKSGLSQWRGLDTTPPVQVGSVPSDFTASSSTGKYSQKCCSHFLKRFLMECVCLSIKKLTLASAKMKPEVL